MLLSALTPVSLAWAQSSGGLNPTASIAQTFTDNAEQSSNQKTSESITRLSAGLGYASRSGMVQGRANYAISQVLYARRDERNTLQHSLLADLTADLVPGRGSVNLMASVAQTAKSAFGAQPSDDGRGNDNTTELATLSLSPRWNGALFGLLAYSATGAYQVSDTVGTDRGDSTLRSATLSLSPLSAGRLSWNLSFRHQLASYKAGNSTETDSVNLGAGWQIPEADLSLRASTGREYSDLAGRAGRGRGTWTAGASWVPSPRTSLDATVGHRPSGKTYQLGLSYRTALTIWRASASRNLAASQGLTSVSLGTNYDLFFAQFASLEPDPVKRDVLVLDFLNRNGLARNGLVRGSFLSSAQTIDERLDLSTAWRSGRSAVTLSYSHSQSQRADATVQADDDLANSSRVRMDDLGLNLSHQLAPDLNANLNLGTQRSRGDLAAQTRHTRSASVSLGGRASSRASWSLAARRNLNETGLRSYSESSLTGTYSLQF